MMAVNFKDHLLSGKHFLNLIIIISSFIIYGQAAKLTVPRILLPYNTGVPTNYTLEVKEGGCYKWYCTYLKELTVFKFVDLSQLPKRKVIIIFSSFINYNLK